MSGNTSTRWLGLLNEKKAAFINQGCELPSTISSERSFCSHFERLCRDHNEKYYTRLLVKLQYGSINAFASAVDAVMEYAPPNSLAGVVAGGVFMAFKCTCEAGAQLTLIAELLGKLNSIVPQLGADIHWSQDDSMLQISLQEIFGTYVDSLLCIISSFNNMPPPTDFDPLQTIENRLVETSKLFEMGRATFERDLARPYPQRSFSDGSAFGNLHPYDTQARFRPLRRLGRGSFGEVDEVEEVSTKEVYARKHIQFPSNKAGAAAREDEVRNEVQVMRKLTHQHIATVLFWLKEQDSCNIFMKPAGDYDLWCYLENCIQEGYPTKRIQDILPWFGCLLDALAFAHRLNVTHRDIKPSNILIKDSQVYLADFGSAKDFTLQGTSKTSNYNVCGSAVYLAPETRSEHPRGRQADVFSLGCVLSEMLTVCSNRSLEAYQAWRLAPDDERGIYAFRSNLPKVDKWLQSLSDDNSDGWRDVLVWQIKCMLYKEPERRNSADKGLNFLISHQQQRLICPNH